MVNNRIRVMGNGELYSIKKVLKMVLKFDKMNWIEQQSFLVGVQKDLKGKSRIKKPPNELWTKKLSLKETKNKDYA